MIGVVVSDVYRAGHGELEALISVSGETIEVSRRYGSWGIERVEGVSGWIEVKAPYTYELQRKAREFEKAEVK